MLSRSSLVALLSLAACHVRAAPDAPDASAQEPDKQPSPSEPWLVIEEREPEPRAPVNPPTLPGSPPGPDMDGDGIADADDLCPSVSEDYDGFQDMDGCPEPDNDMDGFLDVDDRCPMDPEDMDGIDDFDGCPDVPLSP